MTPVLCVIPPSDFNVFKLISLHYLIKVAELVRAKTNFHLIFVIATDNKEFWTEFQSN